MPVLHVLAGCNGAGKTTLYDRVIGPATRLPFVNADLIARREFPGDELRQAYAAARLAAEAREAALHRGRSFVTETVFSHPSKIELLQAAQAQGFRVTLHAVMIPEALAVARSELRRAQGGHAVPEDKVRARYRRLWPLVGKALSLADEAVVYDNTLARRPFRVVAQYREGEPLYPPDWPSWSPLA